MCSHWIILLLVFAVCAPGYAEQSDMQKIFDMIHCIARDTAELMQDVKMLTYRQEVETEKVQQRMDEQEAMLKNITALLQQESRNINCEPASLLVDNQYCANTENAVSGLTTIFLPRCCSSKKPINLTVYCDQTIADGGWLVFLRRMDGAEDFPNKLWQDYVAGFGNLTGSFWLGLHTIHEITRRYDTTLRIQLQDWDDNIRYAEYEQFSISGEDDGYRLSIGAYSGDAGDSLAENNGQMFSTKDKDQDSWAYGHCSEDAPGAWWYWDCSYSCLTGQYFHGGVPGKRWHGILWKHWRGDEYSYKRAEMMLKIVR